MEADAHAARTLLFEMKKKMELLAPAGDLEKLKIAIIYGADAVYFGGSMFSLRAGAGGLSIPEIREGLKFAHDRGRKCYLTVNIYPHNEDIGPLADYLRSVKDLGIDGFLVSDPGVVEMVREIVPDGAVHISTQANTTNTAAARFWASMGAKRIVLARELSLTEIRQIRDSLPETVELEAFVHGAMCISYSGRCLLSNFMAERDSNRGSCAHPCRWHYTLEEEKRPGEHFPIEEDARGTYIFNSNDLCMIEHIDDLAKAGVSSAKIEGRMKSIYYVATVTAAYRRAIDAYYAGRYTSEVKAECLEEVGKASHRRFTTGFYYGKPTNKDQNYESTSYIRDYDFTGLVRSYDEASGMAVVEQRNKMSVGDTVEIFGPYTDPFEMELTEMRDFETGEPVSSAPHPQQMLTIRMTRPVRENFMIRLKKRENSND